MSRLRRLWRLCLLLGCIALAVVSVYAAVSQLKRDRELRGQLAHLSAEQTRLQDQHDAAVSAGEQLATDPQARTKLLKDRMGYAQPNEVPIVVDVQAPVD